MKKIIEISNLSIGYNDKTLLKDINISITKNKMIALIGRNGTGKSTLLRTMAGLQPSLSGKFEINSKNFFELPTQEKAKLISWVATKNASIGDITVNDFISFGRYPYTNWLGIESSRDNEIINNTITLCGLEAFNNRNYLTLSDGEKQTVNIARAIAQDTPLIILDEPTAHLDLINKVEILKLLKSLVKNHDKSIIFSTHQIEYAMQICDEIWVIQENGIHSYTPSEIIDHGVIENVFNSNHLFFDGKTNQLVIKS